jgi:TolB-like protein/class 3 adenylate cyclase/tetratricopeptide (TPR) repeat protein
MIGPADPLLPVPPTEFGSSLGTNRRVVIVWADLRFRGAFLTDERVERRLAAVLAADVAGYSRLMGLDEVGTLQELTLRRKILDGLIASHRGRIANTAGDSVLAEFGSAVDAVQCAVQAQAALAEANASTTPDRQISFRIGIHVGDVMVKGGDLFGDGVNIAARLQGIAEPGGICMSDDAYRQIRGKVDTDFDDMGAQTLKNITEPMRSWRLRLSSAVPPISQTDATEIKPALALPDKPSIAVLPFQNMSGDPEQEYFADGMVEDIITALSRFKSLFVIARNSSFTYKGKVVDIKRVGRELGVRYVLEGSVRKAGNRVRITGQLIAAATGAHLWADRFDGPLEDIFDLQDKVTTSVVAAIAPSLELAEIDRSERKPTESLDATDCYYRGIHHYRLANREGNAEALRLARQAIALDPNFATAHGLAAACYSQQKMEGWLNDDVQQIAEGKQYALRALELGADDAYALCRAAHFFGFILLDSETADAIVDRALAVNPNYFGAWQMRGFISAYLGKHEDAVKQFLYAMRLNPLDPLIHTVEGGLAIACFFLRRFDDALSWVTKSLARQKNYAAALRFATVIYAVQGRIADAQSMQACLRQNGAAYSIAELRAWLPFQHPEDLAFIIEAYRLAGVPE